MRSDCFVHGRSLQNPDENGIMTCLERGRRYREVEPGVLRCLDWPEDKPLLLFSLTGQMREAVVLEEQKGL